MNEPTRHEVAFTKILVKAIKDEASQEAQAGIVAYLLTHRPDPERVNAAIMKAGGKLRVGEVRQ